MSSQMFFVPFQIGSLLHFFLQIGAAVLNRVMSTAHLTLISLTCDSLTSDLVTSTQALLISGDADAKLATLNYLQSSITDLQLAGDSLTFQTLKGFP